MLIPESLVTGVVLVGGRSLRFGSNKALALWSGKRFLDHILQVMDSVFEKVVLVTNSPEVYVAYQHEVIKDFASYEGPLCGLISAYEQTRSEHLYLTTCDTPLLNELMIRRILRERRAGRAAIPIHDDVKEYLMGIYPQNYSEDMKLSYDLGIRSFHDFCETRADIDWVPVSGEYYQNINTLNDLKRLESIYDAH